jgi:hypothetical protein
MARTRLNISFVAKTMIVLSERREKRESIAIAKLTSFERFAAKKGQFLAERYV